jgi:hypothetical protein
MGAIYSSAQITIIAAAGESPSFGIPGISRSHECVDRYEALDTGYLFLQTPLVDDVIANSVWASRAWSKHISKVHGLAKVLIILAS